MPVRTAEHNRKIGEANRLANQRRREYLAALEMKVARLVYENDALKAEVARLRGAEGGSRDAA